MTSLRHSKAWSFLINGKSIIHAKFETNRYRRNGSKWNGKELISNLLKIQHFCRDVGEMNARPYANYSDHIPERRNGERQGKNQAGFSKKKKKKKKKVFRGVNFL